MLLSLFCKRLMNVNHALGRFTTASSNTPWTNGAANNPFETLFIYCGNARFQADPASGPNAFKDTRTGTWFEFLLSSSKDPVASPARWRKVFINGQVQGNKDQTNKTIFWEEQARLFSPIDPTPCLSAEPAPTPCQRPSTKMGLTPEIPWSSVTHLLYFVTLLSSRVHFPILKDP